MTTHPPLPYVIVGPCRALDPSDDRVVRGVDYQETLTSFPSVASTGSTLRFREDLPGPAGRRHQALRAHAPRPHRRGRAAPALSECPYRRRSAIRPAGGPAHPRGPRRPLQHQGVAARSNAELAALRTAGFYQFDAGPEPMHILEPSAPRSATKPPILRRHPRRDGAHGAWRSSPCRRPRTVRGAKREQPRHQSLPRGAAAQTLSSRSRIENGGELVFEVGMDLLENGIRGAPAARSRTRPRNLFQLARGLKNIVFEWAAIPYPDPRMARPRACGSMPRLSSTRRRRTGFPSSCSLTELPRPARLSPPPRSGSDPHRRPPRPRTRGALRALVFDRGPRRARRRVVRRWHRRYARGHGRPRRLQYALLRRAHRHSGRTLPIRASVSSSPVTWKTRRRRCQAIR